MFEDILWDIRYFIEDHKKGCIIFGGIFLFLVIFVVGMRTYNKNRRPQVEPEVTYQEPTQNNNVVEEPTYVNEEYQKLLKKQDSFKAVYGDIPEGFLWDTGRVIHSQGDKSFTIEDTVFAYLNGIQTLDMLTVQRYSNNSRVVSTYQDYFTSSGAKRADTSFNFLRNVYREALMSIQTSSLDTSSTFAENKAVVTVNAKMLDLSDKEFWNADKQSIFKNLYLYALEDDDAKYQSFLYNYIISYYRSGTAKLRDVQFTLTLQKYPQYDSGWLVAIDSDIATACTYKEGTLISKYILQEYRDYGREEMKKKYKEGTLDLIPTYIFGISGEDTSDSSSSYYTDFSNQGGSLSSDVTVNNDGSVQSNETPVEQGSSSGNDYVYVPGLAGDSTNPLYNMVEVPSQENTGIAPDNSASSDTSGLDITTTDDF